MSTVLKRFANGVTAFARYTGVTVLIFDKDIISTILARFDSTTLTFDSTVRTFDEEAT